MNSSSYLKIRGAKEHNLKNIDLDIPKNQLVVITGLSGSGKSSLAFDTIFAEGQRRYMESLSSYARQFLGMLQKPQVQSIEGIAPTISIDQKTTNSNPRSTVGTLTEIYDHLRVFFSTIGIPICPHDGSKISATTIDEIVNRIFLLPEETRLTLYAPIVMNRKGQYQKQLQDYFKKGFSEVKVDGKDYLLEEILNKKNSLVLDKNEKHTIWILIDKVKIYEENRSRIFQSIELCVHEADGNVVLSADGKEEIFSTKNACPKCGFSIPEIHPRLFSFNLPEGACENCSGLGHTHIFHPDSVCDFSKSIAQGAIRPLGDIESSKWYKEIFDALAKEYQFSLYTPFAQLTEEQRHAVLYGTGTKEITIQVEGKDSAFTQTKPFEGIIPMIERRFHQTKSPKMKQEYMKYMQDAVCETCQGTRLKDKVRCIQIQGKSISDYSDMQIKDLLDYLKNIQLSETEEKIVSELKKEILSRLSFLDNVGLYYLSLSRKAGTLSGGEMQRIRLAAQIGSQLTGIIYVLDEPTIGLHQKDNQKMLDTLRNLRDLGNTLIVVEHDEQIMRESDYLIDIGPFAGKQGGEVLVAGPFSELQHQEEAVAKSSTLQYLMAQRSIDTQSYHRNIDLKKALFLKKAATNNLKDVSVHFPLGVFIGISGVSGSGKSSLINGTLVPAILSRLKKKEDQVFMQAKFQDIEGIEYLENVIHISQDPIGRTPRSNPATYVGVFDLVREVFTQTKDSKIRGYKVGRFSFNVPGGRCEHCQGEGTRKIEMHFLADVFIPCEVCKGRRYNQETLEVHYKNKNIFDVLQMTVLEAVEFFDAHPKIIHILNTLVQVGLGYLTLGFGAPALSGGEAQRLKLAKELSRKTKNTLYILDEPTTGLHFEDIKKLITILQHLVDQGNTVLVIEHNLDLLRSVDYLIDIGPLGGKDGGEVLFAGKIEDVKKCKKSFTAQYL